MNYRYVFCTPDLATAQQLIAQCEQGGVASDHLFIVGNRRVEKSAPERRLEADSDFMPALWRGAGIGVVLGIAVATIIALVWGVVSFQVLALGAVLGAAIGGWASSLFGSALPDPVRQQFDKEIKAGKVLVIVDTDEKTMDSMEDALTQRQGVVLLPFEKATVTVR